MRSRGRVYFRPHLGDSPGWPPAMCDELRRSVAPALGALGCWRSSALVPSSSWQASGGARHRCPQTMRAGGSRLLLSGLPRRPWRCRSEFVDAWMSGLTWELGDSCAVLRHIAMAEFPQQGAAVSPTQPFFVASVGGHEAFVYTAAWLVGLSSKVRLDPPSASNVCCAFRLPTLLRLGVVRWVAAPPGGAAPLLQVAGGAFGRCPKSGCEFRARRYLLLSLGTDSRRIAASSTDTFLAFAQPKAI